MNYRTNIIIKKPTSSDLPRLIKLWRDQYKYNHDLDSIYYVSCSLDLDKKFEQHLTKAIKKNDPYILVAQINQNMISV